MNNNITINHPVDPKGAVTREDHEKQYGKVWSTPELTDEFEVIGFYSPCVVVKRKIDSVKGSMLFTGSPRFYHSFKKD